MSVRGGTCLLEKDLEFADEEPWSRGHDGRAQSLLDCLVMHLFCYLNPTHVSGPWQWILGVGHWTCLFLFSMLSC